MAVQAAIHDSKLAEIFKNYSEIMAVYLFGSQVEGKTDRFSAEIYVKMVRFRNLVVTWFIIRITFLIQ